MTKRLVSIRRGEDGTARCWWCAGDGLYEHYHDTEWGRPRLDDEHLFEHFALEGFQAGLSWILILRRRAAFRRAFADYDLEAIARFNRRSVERLLRDAGIIRNRAKIESTINNARRAIELIQEFGSIAAHLWRFEPKRVRRRAARRTMPTSTRESEALSRDLRRRGWSFVGPTGVYALMQATGLVNDHVTGCDYRSRVESERSALRRPAIR